MTSAWRIVLTLCLFILLTAFMSGIAVESGLYRVLVVFSAAVVSLAVAYKLDR